jgi:glycosyltransferase involved in cell wall biosynthesis
MSTVDGESKAGPKALDLGLRPRIGFINEGVHGHTTVDRRMRKLIGRRNDIEPWFARVPEPNRLEARLVRRFDLLGDLDLQPLRWRLRYSWRTRRIAAEADSDALYVQSQACALLGGRSMRTTPWILSVDATSRQFAELEYWRPRDRFSSLGEGAIESLERRAYRRASAVVAWSHWTARSLREDFGVPEDRIVVLHPGVPVADPLERNQARGSENGRLRVLFVGNNVERKGLGVLLAALERTRCDAMLDVVTHDPVEPREGVTVHGNVDPDSEALRRRYLAADLFAMPTFADCVPLAVVEGMAAGLPVVSTEVAAIPELVGDAGAVVPPGDAGALAAAIDRLAADAALRRDLGERAVSRVQEHYEVHRQTERLVGLLKDAARAEGAAR